MAKDEVVTRVRRKTAVARPKAAKASAAKPAAGGEVPRAPKREKVASSRAGNPLMSGQSNLRLRLKEQKQNFIQSQILEVAAELIAARGFRAVTIDDISATLGYSKSVIYYYLESKNDILWRIFRKITDSYFESLNKIVSTDDSPEIKLREIVRLHATNVMTYRAWTAIYQREEVELDEDQQKQVIREKREYDAAIERVYSDGVKSGILKDIPVHIAVAGLMGACNSIQTWYNPEGPTGVAEIAQHYVDLLADGFLVHPSKS